MTTAPVVFVVDDDPSVRSSLKFLISSVGLQVESFDSAEAVLQRKLPDVPSCLMAISGVVSGRRRISPRFKSCWGSSPRSWRRCAQGG